jgi:competence protein ComEA
MFFHPVTVIVLALLLWMGALLSGEPAKGCTVYAEHSVTGSQLTEGAAVRTAAGLPKEKLDVNSASVEELEALEGLSKKQAEAIVQWRTEHGSFSALEDITQVKGIGGTLLEELRPYLKADDQESDGEERQE